MLTAQVRHIYTRAQSSHANRVATCDKSCRPQGHLFHIDFEYILGNDPKPFAPPMKLCEQMVVAMGGRTSKVSGRANSILFSHLNLCAQEYIKFQRLACRAFLILRQQAAIVVNMFDLVAQDIFDSISTHGAAPRLLERFQLNLSDNDAVAHMQQVRRFDAWRARAHSDFFAIIPSRR